MKIDNLCPCGSGQSFKLCCGPYLSGDLPETAEQLMRSRYTAFTRCDEQYLIQSWHPDTRPQNLNLVDQKNIKWVGLKILRHEPAESSATVEFVACYKVNGKAEKIHELSRFIKQDSRWFYVDGDNIP